MKKFDVIVIGCGPGGFAASVKLAQSGLEVAVIESCEVGGTCLNRGCIPTKAFLHSAGVYSNSKNAEAFGIHTANCSFDINKIYAYKDRIVNKLKSGMIGLLKSKSITLIKGFAKIENEKIVTVTVDTDIIQYTADKIIIATGSMPYVPPIKGAELDNVFTSDIILSNSHLYKNLVIIGGGVIGVEFAEIFSSLDCKVTLIEAEKNLLSNMDRDISKNIKVILKKHGVEIYTLASVNKIYSDKDGLICSYTQKEKEYGVHTDGILIATGRKPCADLIFDNNFPIKKDHGKIVTDSSFETSVKGIYAIGDVTGKIELAHNATAQGISVAEEILGEKASIDLSLVPSCVYSNPEIACVGLTENQARKANYDVKIGKASSLSNSRETIALSERGFVKLVFDKNSDKLLGAQMMCSCASDMIGEMSTAIANGLTAHDLVKAMRSHPTFNEIVGNAINNYLLE